MTSNKKKLYTVLLIACVAGYSWLFLSFQLMSNNYCLDVCWLKNVTKIPCPSCGVTRSILALTKGHFATAFYFNPLGYLIAFILFFTPIWILFDFANKKETLLKGYQKMESYLKKPQLGIPLILLVILNWIWNLIKG